MKKPVCILLVFLAFQLLKAASQLDTTGWLSIDCGNDSPSGRLDAHSIRWDTDTGYTNTGVNKQVRQGQVLEEMNSLRLFPNRTQNCYIFPVYAQTYRYLIRAGFHYGNYDGLSRPPTFDLHLDGKKWSTVNTSSIRGPIYHEAIYVTQGSGNIGLCLVKTRDGEIPFISSIEAVPLLDSMYPQMETNTTFHLVTRTNIGGYEVRSTDSDRNEKYNRIWTSAATPPNCLVVDTTQDYYTSEPENDPPQSVLSDFLESLNASYPILLSVDFPEVTPRPAYFVLYFTEWKFQKINRIFQIYINGQEKGTVTTELDKCKVVTMYPVNVVGPTINVTLAPTSESTLPPIISAMEIFTRRDLDPVHETPSAPSASSTHEHLSPKYFIVLISLLLVAAVVALA